MNKVSWIMGLVAFAVVLVSAVIQFARANFMGSMQGLFATLGAVALAWVFFTLWKDVKSIGMHEHPVRVADKVPMLVASVSGALFGLALLFGALAHL